MNPRRIIDIIRSGVYAPETRSGTKGRFVPFHECETKEPSPTFREEFYHEEHLWQQRFRHPLR